MTLSMSFPGWTVAFTERADGDLRVSARTAAEPVAEVQERVLERLGVAAIVVPRQVHGAEIILAGEPSVGYVTGGAEADGVASTRRGIAAGVHVADCLPVAIGGAGGVVVVHAGWRGLAAGIVGEGVRTLRDLGVTGDLDAVIGPGVGGCCYETGDELRARFEDYHASRGRLLDLKAIASAQLREAGVAAAHDVGLCTICAPHARFFSHRREGASSGRQGGFAWLR